MPLSIFKPGKKVTALLAAAGLACASVGQAQSYEWNSTSGGNWSRNNWTPAAPSKTGPDGVDVDVTFGTYLLYSSNIRLQNNTRTLGSALFNNTAASYNITGGTLNFQATSGQADVTVLSGSHTLSAALRTSSDLLVTQNGSLLTVSGSLANQGHQLTFGGSGQTTVSGSISGTGSLVKVGPGTLLLTASNTYTGTTTVSAGTLTLAAGTGTALGGTSAVVINGGTLLLNNDNQINNAATITLGGGTLSTGGYDDTVGTLTLTSSSVIDLGSSTGSNLYFAGSAAQSWSSSALLTIQGWSGSWSGGGADRIYFGNSPSALTSAQISQIRFVNPTGAGAGTYYATLLSTGELVPTLISPVPEPSTIIGGAGVVLLLGWDGYRRYRKAKQAKEAATKMKAA